MYRVGLDWLPVREAHIQKQKHRSTLNDDRVDVNHKSDRSVHGLQTDMCPRSWMMKDEAVHVSDLNKYM